MLKTTFSIALLTVALTFVGCGDGDGPSSDATTTDAMSLDAASACPEGTLGCACEADGACARGQCVANVCTLCTRGDLDCLCRADDSCKGTLLCRDGLCEGCPPGALGCACTDGGCDEGGLCVDGSCASVECPPGSDTCPCRRASVPACDATLTCLGDGTCHGCEADRPGCPCASDDSCAPGLLCDGGCRRPRTCAQLVDEGFCGANEACIEADGLDATCASGTCQDGFVFDGARCVPGRPNCLSDTPGSLLNVCTSELRRCIETDADAICGACLDDAVETNGECVGRLSCGTGSCLNSEYCDTTGATPTCTPLPCAAGEAKEGAEPCRPCGFSCAGTGLSGRVWPFRTNTSTCICETIDGFFMPPGGDTRPEVCDVDADGWVREEVRDPALTSDPALVANARCGLIEVTSVLLRDEYGIDAEIVSCAEGLVREPDPTRCFDRIPMPLVESLRNDTPGPLVETTTPPYGGRPLRAQEVNALTKACVSALGDYNDDGVEDLLEVQTPPARLGDNGRERLQSFAYFIETHRAYVERDGARTPRLVIEERFRCDPNDFALRYDPTVTPAARPADAYSKDNGATYWRSCTRGADPTYDPDAQPPEPGYDFAQWSCPDGGAGCDSIAPGPPHRGLDLRVPITFGSPAPDQTTLCELGSGFPADREWRGLHHASQFKCVGIGEGPGRRPLTDFAASGPLVMNLCEAKTCAPGDSGCSDSRRVIPGAASLDPILACRASAAVDGSDIGFAAVRYAPYGPGFGGEYEGGCISEDAEYKDTMCPDPVFGIQPDDDAFGANTCYVAPCPFAKADCDGDPLNGCELNATTNQNCGDCGVRCAPANGTGDCSSGGCQIATCQTGYADCNDDPSDGCETNTRTTTDCGGCGIPCEVEGGSGDCGSGQCVLDECGPGFSSCPGRPGCTPTNTLNDCGGCGVKCQPSNVGAATCQSGSCNYTICTPGFGDCDGNRRNGCEANTLTDVATCGGCTSICYRPGATRKCLAGTCLIDQCVAGYGNCDNRDSNGCETLVNTTTHCGGCDVTCDLPATNAHRCISGSCVVDSCDAGRANCNSNQSDGCEVNLDNNPSCGAAANLGTFNGDSTCGAFCAVNTGFVVDSSQTGRGEAWFKVTMSDNIGVCSGDLNHRIELDMPSNADYDVYIYRQCGGSAVKTSRNSMGQDENFTFSVDDTSLDDGSFNYWINIRYNAGSSCSEWALTVKGTRCGQ